jgi:CheY-like chemotaxis protein/anti-sigma regulatory factor (Ser/Thr protein kinase)
VLRLQQLVANLLSNAVKFTPSGGHVEVRLGSAGSQAEIQVADTGQGIDPGFLPHLFERFTQADASSTRQHGGIGLGLAIVKALAERHGGTVHAESRGVGKGATFTVRLPVLASHKADEIVRPRIAETPAAQATRLDGIRVLLAEDDVDAQHVLTLILEIAGAQVEAVGSVRGALSAFDGFRPDVVVSAVGLADEDGYALVRRVRAREIDLGGKTPAIALTGYVTPEDRARLLEAGFQLHLRKPVEPSEIVAAVASLAARGVK